MAVTKKKCGQANKMEQVSAMFGKRLGEEFTEKRRKAPALAVGMNRRCRDFA